MHFSIYRSYVVEACGECLAVSLFSGDTALLQIPPFYLEIYYNHYRLCTAIGYRTSVEVES
ncbi:MAG: hypothetical protein R3F28_05425 [Candidatus Kapaibacterium sp.]